MCTWIIDLYTFSYLCLQRRPRSSNKTLVMTYPAPRSRFLNLFSNKKNHVFGSGEMVDSRVGEGEIEDSLVHLAVPESNFGTA